MATAYSLLVIVKKYVVNSQRFVNMYVAACGSSTGCLLKVHLPFIFLRAPPYIFSMIYFNSNITLGFILYRYIFTGGDQAWKTIKQFFLNA
jgi:hypothetical protein